MKQKTLTTERLSLRPFVLSDALRVRELANHHEIADVTANIPHPYPEGLAEEWISSHSKLWKEQRNASFAIVLTEEDELIGSISIMKMDGVEGELGYWVGLPYWGKGFCTEAAKAVVDYGFELGLNRIHAHHLTRNVASGKVLQKVGFNGLGESEGICGYQRKNEPVFLYELKKEL